MDCERANEMELDSDLQRMEWCSLCFKTNSGQLFSLRYLCRHLKIEFRQLFFKCVRKIQVHSEQVGMLDVKMNLEEAEVNLCSECGERIEKFSDLFKQLEKIQLEMEWYLEEIRKLVGENDKERKRFKELMKNDGNINSLVWMEMVRQLRKSILLGKPHYKSKPGLKLKRCSWKGSGGVSTSKNQDNSRNLSLDVGDLSIVKTELCPESGEFYNSGLDAEASSSIKINEDNSLTSRLPDFSISASDLDNSNIKEKNYEDMDSFLYTESVTSTPQQPTIETGLSEVNDDDDFRSQELDDEDNHPEEEDSDHSWRQSSEDDDVCSGVSEDSDPASPATEPNSKEPQKSLNLIPGTIASNGQRLEGSKKVQCKLCQAIFACGRGFHRHFKNVHLSERIQCHLCTKRFGRPDHFHRHLRSVHNTEPKGKPTPVAEYKCDIGECNYTSKVKDKFQNHQKICKGIMKVRKIFSFKCSTCGSGCASEKDLKRHKKKIHSGRAYTCDECGKEFTARGTLKSHVERIHLKIRYNCDHIGCDKSYSDKYQVMLHKINCEKPPPSTLPQHESEETESLELELMKTEEPQDLDYTMDEAKEHYVQLSDNKYECKICNFVVKEMRGYRRHFRRIHVKTREFECDSCSKKYATRGDLNVHLKHAHVDGEMFRCGKGECQYTTKTEAYFKAHQRRCEGLLNPSHLEVTRNYMCSTCGKRFKSTENLKAHQNRVHGSGRKFVCEQCGKVFKTKEYLWVHNRREHLGVRYSCDNPGCGKKYKSVTSLKDHKSVCGVKLSELDK